MKKLQSLDSICKQLGGQCITFDASKKWTLDDAKAFVKAHWVDGMGMGLTVFKFYEGSDPYTTILLGYFNVDLDSIITGDSDFQITLTGSYIAYDDYNQDLRDFTDGTSGIEIHLSKYGGAYLA